MEERIKIVVEVAPDHGVTAEELVEQLTGMVEAAQDAHPDNFKARLVGVSAAMGGE